MIFNTYSDTNTIFKNKTINNEASYGFAVMGKFFLNYNFQF